MSLHAIISCEARNCENFVELPFEKINNHYYKALPQDWIKLEIGVLKGNEADNSRTLRRYNRDFYLCAGCASKYSILQELQQPIEVQATPGEQLYELLLEVIQSALAETQES